MSNSGIPERTNAVRTNAVRTNAVRTNAVRTNAVRTNAVRTNAVRTNAYPLTHGAPATTAWCGSSAITERRARR